VKRTLLFIVILASVRVADAAVLTVNAAAGAVRVSEVKPGGAIVLLSCVRGYRAGRAYIKPDVIVLRDTVGTGTIEYRPDGGIPLRSVFAAIDQDSGLAAFGSHHDFPLRVIPIAEERFPKDDRGEVVRLVHDMPRLIVVLTRPSKGAWILRAVDGREADGDPKEGYLALAFEDFQPIAGTEKGPKTLKRGDVIVAIDPSHLDIYAGEIGK